MEDSKPNYAELFQVLSKEFPFIGTVVNYHEFTFGGFENLNLCIINQNGYKYVARVSSIDGTKGTEESIRLELSLLSLLKQKGIPVPEAYLSSRGTEIFDFDGKKGVLVKFCEGEHCLAEKGQRVIWQSREIGKYMGLIHSVTQYFKPANYEIRKGMKSEEVLEDAIEFREAIEPDLLEKYDNIVKQYEQFKQELIDTPLPEGFIHCDMHEGNVLLNTKEEKLSVILDWDDAHWGKLLIDVALGIIEWCTDKDDNVLQEYLQEFLKEYQKNRPLTSPEMNLLWKYVIFITLFYVTWCSQPEWRDEPECRNCARHYISIMFNILNNPNIKL